MVDALPIYVLDSFAVMAHFQAESGGEKVLELLERAENSEVVLTMSLINVGEIVYLVSRKHGKKRAQEMLEDLRSLPIRFYDATEERILAAAWIKSEHPISYADAFAASLAQELRAPLVTGDPEIKQLEKVVDLFWLG